MYSPLPNGFIHILELYPGQEHDQLECILRQVLLDPGSTGSTSSYEALSYVWGDQTRTSPLICNGREIRVTTNLYDALRRLRDPHQNRRLWADAICIDQSNVKERGQQVQMMGSIYETATEVLVWLGHDDGGARKAFDLARDIAELASTNRRGGRVPPLGEVYFDPERWHFLITGEAAQSRWKCLEDLTNRPWFSRTWVIQEIALASKAMLFCGMFTLDWSVLITATQWLVHTRSRPSIDPNINLSMHIALVLGDPNKSDEILMSLLDICREFDATDRRDKVYGLLGHPCLRGFLQKRASRRVLRARRVFNGLPNNVDEISFQDFRLQVAVRIEGHRLFIELQNLGVEGDYIENATSNFKDIAARGDFKIWLHAGCRTENSLVIKHTSILAIALVPSWDKCRNTVVLRCCPAFPPDIGKHRQRAILEQSHHCNIFEDIFYGFSIVRLDWVSEHEALGLTMTASSNDDDSTARYILADYSAFVLENLVEAELVTPDTTVRSEYRNIVTAADGGNSIQFGPRTLSTCMERKLFRTSRGYLGLGSPFLESGDLICILFGTRTPFALRKKDDAFEFVEDCYVHGIMNGEAIEMWQDGKLSDRKFKFQ
ncbi:hypothetical protein MMC30_005151 [Trapelia coarctata]|nr:hypothetical protein [Trapelia coarctata]